MTRNVCIAIDGPVASGKSTIGSKLAELMRIPYLDTGAMYRGVTSLVLARGIDPNDEAAVTEIARTVRFGFPELEGTQAVHPPLLADGVDITQSLRSPAVERNASLVSSYGGVREAMVDQQRRIRGEHSVVMVGRDIGTVVAPDADLKIFLTASAEDRARRRNAERHEAGIDESFETTLTDLKRRDKFDSERPISPLRVADDAIVVDTTGHSLEEGTDRVVKLVHNMLSIV